ncbi:hypothetical protein [Paraglaciecola hydrolytica]|uniref:Uncharacterized protein n=1 Tax=Paraglaciecola hydrolytica TaxID=1799789 RepID=A0A136A252_9ALTE|nr:hypothetical protein [Paraglaciecola hydrolytica]KXI29301.1 hypothetical protein AX660_14260 [Paraglaciecola hydrolytica]
MKNLLLLLCAVFSFNCLAENALLKHTVEWLVESLPKETLLDFDSAGMGFQGCKHREYQMRLTQPLSERFSVDTSLGYAKGKLQWGVFSQQVSMYEWSLVPRFQVSERLSFGLGLVTQSQVAFKTTQGLVFDLPKNTEWLLSSRMQALQAEHYWELTVSSQKWQATDNMGSWFERGLADKQIKLMYNGAF